MDASELGIGKIITGSPQKDAIHCAVAPMRAGEILMPGQHVALVSGWAYGANAKSQPAIGVVDPFLTGTVHREQRFWLFLYPQTITSLRHEWTHPDFVEPDTGPIDFENIAGRTEARAKAYAYLQQAALDVEMTYRQLLEAAVDYAKGNRDKEHLGFDTPDSVNSGEFWEHVATITGVQIKDPYDTLFSCAC